MFSCTVNQYFKDLKSLHEIAVILLPVIINIFCWGSSITKKKPLRKAKYIYTDILLLSITAGYSYFAHASRRIS